MTVASQRVSLRALLKEKGKNQQQLAKSARLSTWTINAACKGLMSDHTRQAIAHSLNVSPETLGEPTLKSKTGSKAITSKPIPSSQEPEVPEEQPTQSATPVASPSLLALVASELTDEQSDALVGAFIRTRKTKGFSESEFAFVESWAEKVRTEHIALEQVLAGNANIDIINNNVKVLDPELSPPKQKVDSRPATSLEDLIKSHLAWGKTAKEWKPYYLSEKNAILTNWIKQLGLKSIGDITLSKFDAMIGDYMKAGKSRQTIEKNAKHLVAFLDWAAEKSFTPVNILAGKSAASSLRQLAKSVGRKL